MLQKVLVIRVRALEMPMKLDNKKSQLLSHILEHVSQN